MGSAGNCLRPSTGASVLPAMVLSRLLFPCGLVAALAGVTLLYAGQAATPRTTAAFLGGLAAMVGGMLLLHRCRGWAASPTMIVLVALLLRLLFLPWPHDSDLNRYLWEGRMQEIGINPYLVAPVAEETTPHRDRVWHGVNHPELPAVYGPAAQLVFRLLSFAPAPALTLKLLFLASDLAILLLLIAALHRYRREPRHAWLYAAHPLPPLLLIGEGHLEPLLMLPLFAGLLALHLGRSRLGLLLFSLAMAVKISLVVLLPFVLRGIAKRFWPWAILPCLLWLPFGSGFFAHLATLADFSQSPPFNSLALTLLLPFLNLEAARMTSLALFGLGWMILWLLDPPKLALPLAVLGLLLLTSPIVHPWYLAMLLPFAILCGSLPWLVLATTAPALLLVTKVFLTTGDWQTPPWLLLLEFLPFALAVLVRLGRRNPIAPAWFVAPQSLSVLVPVRNEEANLADCLASIVLPQAVTSEILVIDGGSIDRTCQLAKSDPRVRLISAAPGRGTQLAAGYRVARGDLVVIVHADSRLAPATLQEILKYCQTHTTIAGGACRARYRQPLSSLWLVERLNDLRVLWTGIAFGDQVQFFRRQALPPEEFPDYRLMEDIELSLRLRQRGAVSLLPQEVSASSRRWQKVGCLDNTVRVVVFCGLFLLLRSLGALSDKGERFYRWYYGKAGIVQVPPQADED